MTGGSRGWNRFAVASVAVGGALLAIAVIVSSSDIERFFRGEANGDLSWGPTLFRAMLALHGLLLIGAGLRMRGRPPVLRSSPHSIPRRDIVILALLTVAGAALRLINLNSQLWFDEVLTIVNFVRLPIGEIVTSFPDQNQHLVYSVLAWLSVTAFGESAWALRLPALVFGIGGIWATYLLGRRLIGGKEALLACALVTFSYHHIWFSQNARGYTGLLCFSVLATWLWLEALGRSSWTWWIAYAVTLVLGCGCHLTMLLVPASHALIWLVEVVSGKRRDARAVLMPPAAWALAATLFLQVFALSLPEFFREALAEVSAPSQWTNPLWLIAETLRGLHVALAGYVMVALGLSLPLFGWLGIFRRSPRAAIGMVLPAVLCAVLIISTGHNLWPRFFFFSMSFALLFLVHGAMTLPPLVLRRIPGLGKHGRLVESAGLATVILMILVSSATIPRCYALPKQNFTGARSYVETRRGPSETAVAAGLAAFAYGEYYAPDWETAEDAAELEALLTGEDRLWLVYTLPVQIQAFTPELWTLIEERFEVEEVFWGTLGGGQVYVCREKAQEEGRKEHE